MAVNEQMVMGTEAFDCGIQKSLIHAGKESIEYVNGTKIYFHYKTIIKEDGTIIDDSKNSHANKPMELIIGKKFKLEIWERALSTMWLNEVARFTVAKELLYDYPIVAKQLRDYYEKTTPHKCNHDHDHDHHHDHKHQHHDHHTCGYSIMEHGLGHPDLDALLKNPKDLEFIFEVLKVEQPGEYKKDSWTLSDEERQNLIPVLKEDGNKLFKEGNYQEAADKYQEALGFLEQFMLREKPNDIEWNELNKIKIPLLLNFSLCKFHLKDYYICIEHTNSILESEPNNVKALFRRAKANAAVWNLAEARADYERCAQLDPTLSSEVRIQLDHLNRLEKEHLKKESEKFRGKLFD